MTSRRTRERYAAFQRDKDYPMVKDFAGLYGFELDDFQVRACREIEDGRGVLVAAPTGSGKTIVGEFAIHLALQTGRKASTPPRSRRCRTRSTTTWSSATAPTRSACSPATT